MIQLLDIHLLPLRLAASIFLIHIHIPIGMVAVSPYPTLVCTPALLTIINSLVLHSTLKEQQVIVYIQSIY